MRERERESETETEREGDGQREGEREELTEALRVCERKRGEGLLNSSPLGE